MSYKFENPISDYMSSSIPEDSGCRAYPGLIVTCVTHKLKNFSKGVSYKVEKIQQDYHWLGAHKLKIEGISGYVNSENFKLVSVADIRNIAISAIVGDASPVVNKVPTGRKIDDVENKEDQLFELIMNRISRDRNRFKGSGYSSFDTMIDIICKGDKTLGVSKEDFNCLKDAKLSNIMDMFIKERIK